MPNPFSGLHVSDDEDDVPQVAPAKTVTSEKKSAPASAPVQAPVAEKSNKPRSTTYRPARPRSDDFEQKGARTTRQQSDDSFVERSKEPRAHHDAPTRRGPKNERQSHDGRNAYTRGAKRDGSGRGNWGKATEDANTAADIAEEPSVPSTPAEPVASEAAAADTTAAVDATAQAEPVVEEPKTFTLEEFKRQKAQTSIKVETTKLRTANEGADQSQWSNDIITPAKTGASEATGAAEVQDHRKTQRSAQKQLVDSGFAFRPLSSSSERGTRGGRGRGRGGRGGREGHAEAPAADATATNNAAPADGESKPRAPRDESRGRGRGRGGVRGGRGGERGGARSHQAANAPNVLSESDFPKL